MFKIFDAFVTLKDHSGYAGKEYGRLEIRRITKKYIYGENYDGITFKIIRGDIFSILDYRGYFLDIKDLQES